MYVQNAEGTLNEPKAPPTHTRPLTTDAFTASLEQTAASHPPSKARRIAALLPQIETAMAQGSPRAHIVTALLGVGIDITPHQLSNVIARLRKQRQDTEVLPAAQPVLSSSAGMKHDMPAAAPGSPATKIVSVPTLAHPLSGSSASRFGTHDPRLLDEVMRSTPDMKALAKLAPRGKP